jgi:hypothetical protein
MGDLTTGRAARVVGPLSIPLCSFFKEPESVSDFVSEFDTKLVPEAKGGAGGGGGLMRAMTTWKVSRLKF